MKYSIFCIAKFKTIQLIASFVSAWLWLQKLQKLYPGGGVIKRSLEQVRHPRGVLPNRLVSFASRNCCSIQILLCIYPKHSVLFARLPRPMVLIRMNARLPKAFPIILNLLLLQIGIYYILTYMHYILFSGID